MDLETYLELHIEWSRRTFGGGQKTLGVTKHIEKEIQEIRQNPTDLEEWIDVIILALDGYWRHGGDPRLIMCELLAKHWKNRNRQWPPVASDDEPTEHIRGEVSA